MKKITNIQEIERESKGREGGNSDEGYSVLDEMVKKAFSVEATFETRCV